MLFSGVFICIALIWSYLKTGVIAKERLAIDESTDALCTLSALHSTPRCQIVERINDTTAWRERHCACDVTISHESRGVGSAPRAGNVTAEVLLNIFQEEGSEDEHELCKLALSSTSWDNIVTYSPVARNVWLCGSGRKSYMGDYVDPSLCSPFSTSNIWSVLQSKCSSPPRQTCMQNLTAGKELFCTIDGASHVRIGTKSQLLQQIDNLTAESSTNQTWHIVIVALAWAALGVFVCCCFWCVFSKDTAVSFRDDSRRDISRLSRSFSEEEDEAGSFQLQRDAEDGGTAADKLMMS